MPTLTIAISPDGPIANLAIGVSMPRQAAMKAANVPVPNPIIIRGLIDTGASGTCIDPKVIVHLGLVATGTTMILTPSTGTTPHPCNQYDVALGMLLGNQQIHLIRTMPVVESHLDNQGIQALIGRDVLKECVLVYDGVASSMILAF